MTKEELEIKKLELQIQNLSKPELNESKEKLELEKLRLEIAQLRKSWLQNPAYLGIIIPAIGTIGTLIFLGYAGFFDAKKLEAQKEILALEVSKIELRKDSLSIQKDTLIKQNQRLGLKLKEEQEILDSVGEEFKRLAIDYEIICAQGGNQDNQLKALKKDLEAQVKLINQTQLALKKCEARKDSSYELAAVTKYAQELQSEVDRLKKNNEFLLKTLQDLRH